MEDSLKKRYSLKLFSNIIGGIIGAVLIAIIPKALGPIAYGQFVYLQDFFMKIIGFLDMGSSIAFFTKLSAKHTRKELITFYFLYSLLVLLIVYICVFSVKFFGYSSFILPDIPTEYIYMGLYFGFFTWFTQIFIKISDAYALTVSVELIKIGHKAVSLLLLLYFVHFTVFNLNSYFYFHYISILSFLLIMTWFFIKKRIFEKKLFTMKFEFKKLFKEFFDYCSPLFIFSVVSVIIGLFDIWLLQKMAGSIQTGFYGLAYSLAAICVLFTSAMTPIITREFAKLYEEKDIKQMRKIFFRYIPMLYSMAAYFGIFVSIESANVLDIFTDDQFKDTYLVLIIMGFYPLYQTYGQLSGSIFYATGQTKHIRNFALISQAIGLPLSILFIYLLEYGAVGLALKVLIIAIIGVNIQLYYNARILNFKLKYFILHQIYAVLFFVILAYTSSIIINFESSLIDFLVSGVLYTVLVTIFTYIFPQVFATTRDEIRLYCNKVLDFIRK